MNALLRRLPAILLAAVLVLGGVGHFVHDLEHAACDPFGTHEQDPCTACSVLHVGAPVTGGIAVAAPAHRDLLHVTGDSPAAPIAALRVASVPRAPPGA